MRKVLVDTNILIDFVNGHSKILSNLFSLQKSGRIQLYVNPVIISEFYTDNKLHNKELRQKTDQFFSLFKILEIDQLSGLICGDLLRTNQAFFLGDGLIAATCLRFDCYLATNNFKDFRKVKDLKRFLLDI